MIEYASVGIAEAVLGRNLTTWELKWFKYMAKVSDYKLYCLNIVFMFVVFYVAPLPSVLIDILKMKAYEKYRLQPGVHISRESIVIARCVYGPFINLPQPCQELATDLLYYYTRFSTLFLRGLAQCSLCPDLDVALSVRIVELLQRAFCRGAIGLGEHLSFLFTLLAGRVPSQASSSSKKSPTEIDASIIGDYQEDLELKTRQRHSAITGVVCACLAQIGDGNLVLSLLGPSIRAQLENRPQLRVVHGLFRVVAVLSRKVKESDGLFLPDSLVDVLPKSAANFLVTVAQLNDRIGESGNELVLNSLKRPCVILMARSPSFTLAVLKVIYDFLQTEVHPLTSRHAKLRATFAQNVLEIVKNEKLDSCLSSSRDTVKAIMQTIETHEDTQMSEGRELKRLHEQLQTATNALYGRGFVSVES